MTRAFNFSAGPAALPTEVLEIAQAEMLDYQGRGLSVMEMSHRSDEFVAIAAEAEQDCRDLLDLSDDYAVLFMQGGATGQFAAVPLNLLGDKTSADYVSTGSWSKKAIAEAKRYCKVNVAATSESTSFDRIPPRAEWKLDPNAAYVHICSNETIGGVEFYDTPDVGTVPLVADMSSNLLSRPMDLTRFGLVYAGAQKNIGPAGILVVIVRRDLLGRARKDIPSLFDYKLADENDSMYNTPPTYAWYLSGLVFKWLKRQGGVQSIGEVNRKKAATLYRAIDSSNFYRCPILAEHRSTMNVVFTLADPRLDDDFVAGADARGLLNLKGHRSVGGIRASLYNAVPQAAVDTLVDYMSSFENEHA